jgi:hypothetical protein
MVCTQKAHSSEELQRTLESSSNSNWPPNYSACFHNYAPSANLVENNVTSEEIQHLSELAN